MESFNPAHTKNVYIPTSSEEIKTLVIPALKRALRHDISLWILLFSNSAALLIAVSEGVSLKSVLALYWVQSVIIGIVNCIRILTVDSFSTEGVLLNEKPVPPTLQTKYKLAAFFAFHYGFFHVVYAIFVFDAPLNINGYYVLGGGLLFFVDHLFSFIYNKKRDDKVLNIKRLMAFPYARIIPMHFFIIFFGMFFSLTSYPFLVFGKIVFLGLKTMVDAGMHVVEHMGTV